MGATRLQTSFRVILSFFWDYRFVILHFSKIGETMIELIAKVNNQE